MDRRHRVLVHGASFTVAAILAIATLWCADLLPMQWLARVIKLTDSVSEPLPVTASLPPAAPVSSASVQPVSSQLLPAGTESSVARTPKPLYLVATVPGRHSREGTASIGANPENPQTYAAGALLTNGTQLAEIYADHVVLTLGAEKLMLRVSTNTNLPVEQRAQGATGLALVGGMAHASDGRSTPLQTTKLENDAVDEVIRSMPHYEADALVGLQVFPGQRSGMFAQLGFESGDVIVAIDGAPIVDPQSAAQLLHGLAAGAAMTVSIRRGNEQALIALDGAAVAALAGQANPRLPGTLEP